MNCGADNNTNVSVRQYCVKALEHTVSSVIAEWDVCLPYGDINLRDLLLVVKLVRFLQAHRFHTRITFEIFRRRDYDFMKQKFIFMLADHATAFEHRKLLYRNHRFERGTG